jgi:hypothetical protein
MGDRVRFHFVGGPDPRVNWTEWVVRKKAEILATEDWRKLVAAKVLTDHGLIANVPRVIKGFHVVGLTSDYEGQPVSLAEAQASGALAAFRNVGETASLLADGAGIMVEPRKATMFDPEIYDLAERIASYLGSPTACRKMAERARARIVDRHGMRPWVEGCRRMIEDVIA